MPSPNDKPYSQDSTAPVQPVTDQPKHMDKTPDKPKVVRLDPSGSTSSVSEFEQSLLKEHAPKRASKPDYKATAIASAKAVRGKAKSKAKQSKVTARPVGSGVGSKSEGERAKTGRAKNGIVRHDMRTKEGVLDRLREIAGGERSADARQACNQLLQHYASVEEIDPNSRVDPAQVCAFLTRCHLHGKDAAAVLVEHNGLRKVAKAICGALRLDGVRLVLGGSLGDHGDINQSYQCDATDKESVGGGDEAHV